MQIGQSWIDMFEVPKISDFDINFRVSDLNKGCKEHPLSVP